MSTGENIQGIQNGLEPAGEATKREKRGKPKARGNGQGSKLRQLPSGSWRWEIRLDGQYFSGTKATKSEAEKERARVITDHDRNLLTNPDKVTVRDYAERWLARLTHISTNTRAMYKRELEHALGVIGELRITQVRTMDIKRMFDVVAVKEALYGGKGKKRGRGSGRTLSVRTLRMIRTHLRAMFTEAVRDQLIYANPAEAIRPMKSKRGEGPRVGVALDFHQAARFYDIGEALYAAGTARLWTALYLGMTLGLRRGEVMGLRWCDVDLDEAILRVRQNLIVQDNQIQVNHFLKTEAGERNIPLPPSAVHVLKRHLADMKKEARERHDTWKPDLPIMATKVGTYTHPDNLERALNSVLKWSNPDNLTALKKSLHRDYHSLLEQVIVAGEAVPKIRLHDLRHTAGTLMLRRGMRVEVVSKILGHASVSITLNVYRHVLESEKRTEMVDLCPYPVSSQTAAIASPEQLKSAIAHA
jgi:integrase